MTMQPIQTKVKECLFQIAILAQNGAITADMKNRLVRQCQNGLRTKSLQDLHESVRTLSFGSPMPEVIEKLLDLSAE